MTTYEQSLPKTGQSSPYRNPYSSAKRPRQPTPAGGRARGGGASVGGGGGDRDGRRETRLPLLRARACRRLLRIDQRRRLAEHARKHDGRNKAGTSLHHGLQAAEQVHEHEHHRLEHEDQHADRRHGARPVVDTLLGLRDELVDPGLLQQVLDPRVLAAHAAVAGLQLVAQRCARGRRIRHRHGRPVPSRASTRWSRAGSRQAGRHRVLRLTALVAHSAGDEVTCPGHVHRLCT